MLQQVFANKLSKCFKKAPVYWGFFYVIKEKNMSRYKAALSHLIVSTLIFSSIIFIVIKYWYPFPFFNAAGGWQGLKIIAGVDLVLGPLLMLIVFDKKKGRVKLIFDVVVIVSMQLSALIYGLNTIYQQRPVGVVFWESSFYSVPAKSVREEDLTQVKSVKIPFIFAEKPTTEQGLNKILERMSNDGLPPHHQVELYKPLEGNFTKILPYKIDINTAIKNNLKTKQRLEEYFDDNIKDISDYVFFPMFSKYKNILLMFNKNGQFEEYFVL